MALSLATRPFASSACTARVSRASRVSRSVMCVKAQQTSKTTKISKDLETALLSAALTAAVPLAAHADEPVAAAAAAVSEGAGGFGAGETALLVTPVVVYAAFSVYREKLNPRASFLDYIYIMVFLAIVANLVSIVAFKTRFF
ncbi:hypothetical protein CHLRE_13g562900v5 [Chlamydomonas reinhardtii]|uniref:Uncharacterized protein n=1 Tax=Chlamydomonas reinhardtii TaxID=3055 RepID=A8HR82_CHLRE|nr:uncharacterized protein CHLRE_13g562900v5 [Chlamydomonas reinhardtii]PNW73533.1 hypothetical protein CHLRE_13g562900v5 [Chlamydomonas reinhardtii]|eukprot:XP_001693403.1 predicted protein [Chlamydomonas reinhardtii]